MPVASGWRQHLSRQDRPGDPCSGGLVNPVPYDLWVDNSDVVIAVDVPGTKAGEKDNLIMKRSAIILIVDVVSFAGFVFLTSTGLLLHYLLPPGSGRWSDIWGFDRHEWGDIHFFISAGFLCALSLHLVIHWRVIVNLLRGRGREGSWLRLGLGGIGLFAILLLAAAPLISPTNIDSKPHGSGWRHNQDNNKSH